MRIFLVIFISFLFINKDALSKSAPESFADLVEDLIPGVVSIASKTLPKEQLQQQPMPRFPEGSPFDDFFKEYFDNENRQTQRPMIGLGSGFIIDKAGIVITNNHVIEGADEITIIMSDQREFEAKLLGRDPKADLAVLKFDPEDLDLQNLTWGNSDEARVGDWTIAIGNPLGLGGTVTAGIISAISRDIGNGPYVKFIQTDASINRGNSGGPLFNIKGEVVGINTAIISQTGGSIGLGFAVPSNSAQKIIQQLIDFGRTKRGWLGVQITPVSKEIAESLNLQNEKGAFISKIDPNGPAKGAGIQEGDIVLKFNNIDINRMSDLPRLVAESNVGSIALVEVWRKNKIIKIEVKLGELPEKTYVNRDEEKKDENEFYIKKLDLYLEPAGLEEGVRIVKIEQESDIVVGDVIIEVNREKIKNINQFLDIINKIHDTGRNSLLLKVKRKENTFWATIKFVE